jgi:hypothetical protein
MAKNIDVVTIPPRNSVQLTIYNSEDLTMVRETRHITFKKGQNLIQFSWANTLIDPTSVEFRVKEKSDKIEILDTTFPGDRPQVLIWNINSEIEGQIECELSYFTSGLNWEADYIAILDNEEKNMQFDGYVRVYNNSGEDYENAQVRLVVGVINLVEKIRELAQRRGIPMPAPSSPAYKELRNECASDSFEKAARKSKGYEQNGQPKDIVKEGVSEYFLYTIEGTETIANGWSKRMQSFKSQEVPFKIVYRMRSYQYGPRPVRFFIWKNDEEHKLGKSPLPDGIVRLFRNNGRDGFSILGQQNVRYIPVKEEIEINAGTDDEIVYEQTKSKVRRFNFKFDVHNDHVIGWDELNAWKESVRNYKNKAITIEIRRQCNGDAELTSENSPKSHDYKTVEFVITVSAGKQEEITYKLLEHMGANCSQNRLIIK